MSADVLREAARLMRERAARSHDANPAPWVRDELPQYVDDYEVRDASGTCIAYSETGHNASMDGTTAEHIASWHPAIATSVADLLDIVEAGWVDYDLDGEATEMHFVCAWALNLARAYLAPIAS